jgi:adenylate cyclase
MEQKHLTGNHAPIEIDLEQFKLHLNLPEQKPLTLQFDTPSRRFYLSVMALVLDEMKKAEGVSFVPLENHMEILALLNETVGGSVGSSEKKNLLTRIYRKWKDALPDLEAAPLFRVSGQKKGYNDAVAKTYDFDDRIKDAWANLFAYRGSREKISLKLSIERLGISLNDICIVYGVERPREGKNSWNRFIEDLKRKTTSKPEPASIKAPAPQHPSSQNEFKKNHNTKIPPPAWWKKTALPIILILMASVSLFLGLKSILEPSGMSDSKTAQATLHRLMEEPRAPAQPITPQIMEKPAIAVLPFVNLSGNPAEDYLSDGITEQIITALAKTPKMDVIARNSSYSYKGKPVKVQEVGRDLGVGYVLEGSIQKSGDRIRITAQLIDAATGLHLWAESYERTLENLFSLQDDITKNIITALQLELTEGEIARVYGRGTDNLEAYLKVMKGIHHVYFWNKTDNETARRFFHEAISLDPGYAAAYTLLGGTYRHEAWHRWTQTPKKSYAKAMELGQKALSLNGLDSGPHMLLATIHAETGQPEKALEAAKKGLSMDPNLSQVHWLYGWALLSMERLKEAIPWIEKAIRLNPIPPIRYTGHLAFCYFWLGYTEKSITLLRDVVIRCPKYAYSYYWGWYLSMALMVDGNPEEALAEVQKALKLAPEPPVMVMGTYTVALHATGQSEKAIAVMEDLMRRRPDNPDVLRHFARLLNLNGRHEEALLMVKQAVKLRPGPLTHWNLGIGYFFSGQYDAAVSELEKAVKFKPEFLAERIWLTAAFSLGGRMKQARAQIAEIHRLNPDYSLENCKRSSFFEYQPEDKKRFINALKNAGLK